VELVDTTGFTDTFDIKKYLEVIVQVIRQGAREGARRCAAPGLRRRRHLSVGRDGRRRFDAVHYFVGTHRIKDIEVAMMKRLMLSPKPTP